VYVIKRRDRHEFFYGFDSNYTPPRLLTSKIRKRLTFYKTIEETLPIMRKIGTDWMVVELRIVKPGEKERKV